MATVGFVVTAVPPPGTEATVRPESDGELETLVKLRFASGMESAAPGGRV